MSKGFSPQDLQSAYKLPSLTQGEGQTVAIVVAYDNPSAEEDLAVYRETYGLPPCTTSNGCFKKVDQRGGTDYPGASSDWAMESALDLDMVSAACPRCDILLVEADDSSVSNVAAAVETAADLGATQINNSYGAKEFYLGKAGVDAYKGAYEQAGVVVTAASGDSGYNDENSSSYNEKGECIDCSPSFPASVASVFAVGGTELFAEGTSGRGWLEGVWQHSGSACTLYVAKPSWQKLPGCEKRINNDVAAVGGITTVSVYNTFGQPYNGWQNVSGTSVSAPLVAGAMALKATSLQAEGVKGVYDHPENWFDVPEGGNRIGIDQSKSAGECAAKLICKAAKGYDGPTGMGTPNGGASTTPPSAIALPARQVTTSQATVSGVVNPEGSTTTYRFEYGESAAYGKQTPEGGGSVAGYTASSAKTAELKGLKGSTRYHYRIVAESVGGTTYSGDRTFFTPPMVHQFNFGPAGEAEGSLKEAEDVAVAPDGHIWVADTGHDRILEFSQTGQFLKSCGHTGSETPKMYGKDIQFEEPAGITVHSNDGLIYISDRGNDRIQVLFPKSCEFYDVFGTAGSGAGQLSEPSGILFGQPEAHYIDEGPGELLVADTGNNRVQVFKPTGSIQQMGMPLASFGSKGTGNGQFDRPTDIGMDPDNPGQYFVVDSGNSRIQKVKSTWVYETETLTLSYLSQFGSKGSGAGQLLDPTAITFDSTTGDLAVTDTGNNRVSEFLPSGTYLASFGSGGSGAEAFSSPLGISADPEGSVAVLDRGNNRVDVWGTAFDLHATTEAATNVNSPKVTLNGSIGRQGLTTYQFEYGPTTSYGSLAPAAPQGIGSGTAEVKVNQQVGNLDANTTYHFRVAATNAFGTAYGKDETFTTPEWAIQASGEPSGAKNSKLVGVSCVAAKECISVGSYKNSSETTVTLAERRNGTNEWAQLSTPNPSGAKESYLEDVSCTALNACTAVGRYKNSSGTTVTLAERWNGSEWVVQSTPNPAGATDSRLEGVSCTSASACTAVGYYVTASGTTVTLAERWNGSEWTIQTTANPTTNLNQLRDVSCASASECWAVGLGTYKIGEGKSPVSIAERWNGTTWTAQTLAEPSGGLTGVSCPTTSSCTAVGSGLTTQRWNGTSWAKQSAATPPSGSGTVLTAVSCTSASACFAVGNYTNSGHTAPVSERWDGTAWSFVAPTDPVGILPTATTGSLEGVSCTTTTGCSATGTFGETGLVKRMMVEGRQ